MEGEKMNCKALFQPISIKGMTIRNRVMLPGMTTRLCLDGGYVSDEMIAYYASIARGGCGLIVLEATSVHAPSAPKNFLQICSDDHIPGLRRLAEAIRAEGAKVSVQLWQGGFAAWATDPALVAMVPSEMEFRGYKMPGASRELIAEAVEAFGEAARRACEAGFDSVEFHCGHQYSPAHFLSGFNKRTDEYGGSLENRARYPLACIRAMRAKVPADFPIGMRVVTQDDYIPDGNTLEDTVTFINWAADAGVDFVNISRGNKMTAAFRYEVPSLYVPKGFNLDSAARIKAGVKIPVAGGGRVVDPELAEAYVADGRLDMVFIGRPQICDPEWCNKAREGRLEELTRCLACNQGCLDNVQQAGGSKNVTCVLNPVAGHNLERTIERTDSPKTVVVIGGGMGGMKAAQVLHQRGHRPILLEASDHLGGQFVLAGRAPHKEGLEQAANHLAGQLRRAGVDVRLNTKADEALLGALKPDAVIAATGGVPMHLPVPGADGENVHGFVDVLNHRTSFTGDTVVIGGGLVGLECAFYLADRGCKVSIVDMLPRIGAEISGGQMIDTMINIQAAGFNQVPNATCVEITPEGVVVEIGGEKQLIPGRNVVLATGSRSADHAWIEQYCAERGIECRVIGDAAECRRVINAIQEAVDAARAI